MIEYIREHLSQEELLCQLAEEASELAQAALKYRRTLNGKNPTPVSRKDAFNNLLEEVADVRLLLQILGLDGSYYIGEVYETMNAKLARWAERLGGTENGT